VATRKKARVADELARLETCAPAELCNAWVQQEGNAAPNVGPALLRRLLAYRLQERQLGGLPAVIARELDRAACAGSDNAVAATRQELTPGARLIREWNGRTITVTVTDNGFLWEGEVRRSLSEIAREVTGAHWSGPRFFGLIRRG
jgi:hypothetical protein